MRKRDLIILLGALGLGICGCITIFRGQALPTASWGLSFRQEGLPPEGPASREQLAALDAAYAGDPEEQVLYLTFDAGYENGVTEQLLDILKEKQVPAAFFVTGHYVDKNADLLRRMVAEGHTVGNHTVNHPDISRLSQPELSRELKGLETAFREKTGEELGRFLRPPQGVYSRGALEWAKKLGYKTVFWSLAHVDWNNDAQPEPEKAVKTLLSRTHNGAVVLLHATSRTNGEILGKLIDAWREEGYRFGTLSDLFDEKEAGG